MKIKLLNSRRILFDGENMRLTAYCDDSDVWFWKIIGEKSYLAKKGFKKEEALYTLSFPQGRQYAYSAYESRVYCIYLGYKYFIENIWNGIFILYPDDDKTRRHLKLHIYDDSRIEVPYEEFIASSPTIWEVREPISDFIFDVEPLVYLYKDNSYIEENLHGAWYNKTLNKVSNSDYIAYSLIAILFFYLISVILSFVLN